MRPTPEDILREAPRLDPCCVRAALESLPAEYFGLFPLPVQAAHLSVAARLSAAEPALVVGEELAAGAARVTVIAYDQPGEFSWISGLMSSLGADIRGGDVFTFSATPPAGRPATAARGRAVRGRQAPPPAVVTARQIIDVFETGPLPLPPVAWAEALQAALRELFRVYADTGDLGAVRERVNNRVAESLVGMRDPPREVLLPLELSLSPTEDGTRTRVEVRGQDTPAFLYCLSNAFAASGLYIDSVRIRTVDGQAVDTFTVTDAAGRPLTSPEAQDRLRLAVLVTKQFSHFVGRSADPFKALVHFHSLLDRLLSRDARGVAEAVLSNAKLLRDLARVLGASDFLWEDFIRLQYENLLPLLTRAREGEADRARPAYEQGLTRLLDAETDPGARRDRLNEFKDQEILRIDLEHILDPARSMPRLAANLTDLAEAVVAVAARLCLAELRERYGTPQDVAGQECAYCILGLGKLGGRELGYASDLELLFVYSDAGRTTGPEVTDAAEFYGRLAERVRDAIRAKRQGIFEIDMRLRPYGKHGPAACSVESFCRYYGAGGDALDYERQALIKMRCITGARELGLRLEAFRDEILYHARQVRYEALEDLRRKQHQELAGGARLNAKFSAGGLVDVEYAVQYLQILHGHQYPELRTPNTREALEALGRTGVMAPRECEALLAAHAFLRRVVNGLRMLRGNARDLELPTPDGLEFSHLARRMGYEARSGLTAAQQLSADLGAHMAYVRDFCHRRFGRPLLVTRDSGNLADVALAPEMELETVRAILARTGFRDPGRAAYNLRQLLGEGGARDVFCQVIVLAEPLLRGCADSDMALNNWERYVRAVISPLAFHEALLREPKELEMLVQIMAASQFLADVLMHNPEHLAWVLQPEQLLQAKPAAQFEAEVAAETGGLGQHEHLLNSLRRARRRHLLRIGTRDLCLRVPFAETVHELSWLADAIIRAVLRIEARALPGASALVDSGRLCVLALGKLGGAELNYSSDIDLLAYLEDGPSPAAEADVATALMQRVIRSLSSTSTGDGGSIYRVDMRLRPFGSQGALVGRWVALEQYYLTQARPWEVQALLKARPVSGAGAEQVTRLLALGSQRWSARQFADDAVRGRRQAGARRSVLEQGAVNIKTGSGGIRDIEFGVQLLQLRGLGRDPTLADGNTLAALDRLVGGGLLAAEPAGALRDAYVLLRRVEHLLQIMHDRQIHSVPQDPESLRALALRLHGPGATGDGLAAELRAAMQVSEAFFRATVSSA